MLTTAARRAGITVLYETKMLRLLRDDGGAVRGVEAQDAEGVHAIGSRGVVLACGGFEANALMRGEFLGAGWERAKVRGSAYNTGDGHRAALEAGAKPFGQWTGCHATPIDVDAPLTGSVEITERMPRRSYPLGITVNRQGQRFFDEGAGLRRADLRGGGQRDTAAGRGRGVPTVRHQGRASPGAALRARPGGDGVHSARARGQSCA